MSDKRLNLLEKAALEIIWLFSYAVGHLPHYVQFYMLAPTIRFIIYRVLRYRVKVVDKNLENSFPERSEQERIAIREGFYTYLSEIILSTLALTRRGANEHIMANLNPERASNLDEFRKMTHGKSWVALSSHFGLWEYEMFWATYSDQRLICVYHPLQNRIFDELYRRLRNHYKAMPMPAKESLRFAIRNGKKYLDGEYVMGLLADQNPPFAANSNWYTFLNQDTTFYDGGEKIALRVGMPVYYIYQRRLSPGRYELCSKPIWDGEESVEPNEITSRYVAALEESICETPYLWLWSHKRWKRSRESVKEAETMWVNNKK